MEIKLDLNKSIEENASLYFEHAKKLKKKLKGAEAVLQKTKIKGPVARKVKIERKKLWYEKFRWFVSSEGFLVIGGRDATSNEIVIKKHTSQGDLVFHTDMAGSPFFVVKSENKKIGDATIKEAANATCSFSRAWKLGLTTQDVFYIKPEQVTKEANPGEFITKGAFMIRGRTTYVDSDMDVAVGLYKGAVMAGPAQAVKKHCEKYVVVKQGSDKVSAVAKKIKSEIGGELDEIIRTLPSGGLKKI